MNNNTFVHKYIKSLIDKEDVTVDMTIGNGNDTFLLAQLSKKVYGFDISSEAIINTNKRIKDFDNVTLIKDNHINVDKYVKEAVRLFIFNLGYLPNSEDKTITKKDDTLLAFKKAYNLLEDNGYIIITFYLGHKGGKEEYYLLDSYFQNNNISILEKYKSSK